MTESANVASVAADRTDVWPKRSLEPAQRKTPHNSAIVTGGADALPTGIVAFAGTRQRLSNAGKKTWVSRNTITSTKNGGTPFGQRNAVHTSNVQPVRKPDVRTPPGWRRNE